ncbi:TPA: hypothetical protein N2D99_002392 [Clostridium botulinum]|nr:hypothetical protein [Clostridium botulinum]
MEKEKRFNNETLRNEEKNEIWLDDYDKHVLFQEFNLRLVELENERKEMNISKDDKEAEINKHIASLKRTMNKFELKILNYSNN